MLIIALMAGLIFKKKIHSGSTVTFQTFSDLLCPLLTCDHIFAPCWMNVRNRVYEKHIEEAGRESEALSHGARSEDLGWGGAGTRATLTQRPSTQSGSD